MSRQRGTRRRPAREAQRYHEQFTRPTRPVAAPATLAGKPISRGRRWAAALAATLVLLFAFTGAVTAVLQQEEGNDRAASVALTIAVVMVPVAFAILAWVSRTPRPLRTVFVAAPGAVAGYLLLAWLLRDPTSSLVLAFGVTGAFVLRAEPVHRLATRLWTVGGAGALTLLLAYLAPVAAVVAAPLLPFPALVVADGVSEAKGRAS